MSVNDLTGQNIQDTYQRVIQTDGASVADGTGSLLPISFDGNNVIISGSLTVTEYSVTSSVTNVVFQQQSGSTMFGDSIDDTHSFTGSLNVTGSVGVQRKINVDRGGQEIAGYYINDVGLLYYRSSSNTERVVFGNNQKFVTMSGAGLNIEAAWDITLDCNAGPIYFADRGEKTFLFNTTYGYMSASGYITSQHITASGNISASGEIIGTIDGGTF